jgi:hypothetical protein
MKENMETTADANEAGADGGFIVIEADTEIDRCYFLYLVEHALCKSHVLSKIRI